MATLLIFIYDTVSVNIGNAVVGFRFVSTNFTYLYILSFRVLPFPSILSLRFRFPHAHRTVSLVRHPLILIACIHS